MNDLWNNPPVELLAILAVSVLFAFVLGRLVWLGDEIPMRLARRKRKQERERKAKP